MGVGRKTVLDQIFIVKLFVHLHTIYGGTVESHVFGKFKNGHILWLNAKSSKKISLVTGKHLSSKLLIEVHIAIII